MLVFAKLATLNSQFDRDLANQSLSDIQLNSMLYWAYRFIIDYPYLVDELVLHVFSPKTASMLVSWSAASKKYFFSKVLSKMKTSKLVKSNESMAAFDTLCRACQGETIDMRASLITDLESLSSFFDACKSQKDTPEFGRDFFPFHTLLWQSLSSIDVESTLYNEFEDVLLQNFHLIGQICPVASLDDYNFSLQSVYSAMEKVFETISNRSLRRNRAFVSLGADIFYILSSPCASLRSKAYTFLFKCTNTEEYKII